MDLQLALQRNFLGAMAELYRDADADIAGRKGVCVASGRCCRFEEYGHRLYVTHAELIYFYAAYLQPGEGAKQHGVGFAALASPRTDGFPLPLYNDAGQMMAGCPWQVRGMCTARDARPLGCRIYFCDAGSRAWQGPVYEYYHQQLAAMHARFGIDYGYVEWRDGLSLLAQTQAGMAADRGCVATSLDSQ